MCAWNLLRGIACKYPSRLCDGDIPSNVEMEFEKAADPLPESAHQITSLFKYGPLSLLFPSRAQVANF